MDAFQDVEKLGVLIEYENMNDFEGKSLDEINSAKNNMFEEIKNTGINVTDEKDVKKAYELILKNILINKKTRNLNELYFLQYSSKRNLFFTYILILG